ncbi:LysR family transcriptional regulator [Amycolatopsis nigrescens]|uniref:LysR family transcriptional regulator n=1 Tax=Amycolatopsis nigrescens TaxID=381445 RepID=UPI00037D1E77|nr:LysR family transcriptional regulator [Amycolatopsis nigrescens]
MELGPHHLRMLDAIAANSSISKAAARLGLSQPAVSTMLRRVERHLGVQLFTRTSEGTAVTPVGAEVVARARAVLAGLDDLGAAVARSPRDGRAVPVLRLGAQPCPALNTLSGQLGMVLPRARVRLRVDPSPGRIVSLLGSGALDVGLVLEPVIRTGSAPPDVERQVLVHREPAFAGLSTQDSLARCDSIGLADLGERQWIDDPLDDGPWPAYFRQACASAGFQPQVSFWTGDWHVSNSLVRSGQAVALYHPTSRLLDGLVLRPLRGDPLAHRVVLMWRREAASAAHRLAAALGDIYRKLATANTEYARWWAEHPGAHPALLGD